jgi:flagellar assembly protein FliH
MSTVIKAGQQHGKLLKRLETVDLADHLSEAYKIVEGAKREAARRISDAKVHAIEIREEAEKRGYRDGYEKGNAEGLIAGHEEGLRTATERFNAEQSDLCSAFSATIAEIDRQKRDLIIAANHDVLTFATTFAAKVAKRAVTLDASAASANLEEALRLVARKTDLVVRINPRDGETIRRFADTITPGGCVVTTDDTQVDATIETQVDQLVDLVLPRPTEPGADDV